MRRSISVFILIALAVSVFGVVNDHTPARADGGEGTHVAPPEGPYTVYLTFDDGPSSTVTPEILDVLQEYDVQATFFLHGYRIAGNEAILQRMIREGHAIGNHLWEQDGLTNASGATTADLQAAWQKTEDAIIEALGPELAEDYLAQPVKLIRQPGGSAQPFPVPEGVTALTYNWHVSSGDSAPWNPGPNGPSTRPWNYVYGNVVLSWFEPRRYYSVYDYGDGAIVLMHDVQPVLSVALGPIIEDLIENGASFGVLPRPYDEPGTLPVLIGVPPDWYAYHNRK